MGVYDKLKGQVPVGLVVLKAGVDSSPEDIIRGCVALVRQKIGPVAAFRNCVIVDRLPKTRSGKILRGTMSSIADGKDYKVPATIDEPEVLDEIAAALKEIGYPKAED